MTGYSTIRSAVSAMRLGAFDYLPKPFTDDELIDPWKGPLKTALDLERYKKNE